MRLLNESLSNTVHFPHQLQRFLSLFESVNREGVDVADVLDGHDEDVVGGQGSHVGEGCNILVFVEYYILVLDNLAELANLDHLVWRVLIKLRSLVGSEQPPDYCDSKEETTH